MYIVHKTPQADTWRDVQQLCSEVQGIPIDVGDGLCCVQPPLPKPASNLYQLAGHLSSQGQVLT